MYLAWGSVEGFGGNIKWPDYKRRNGSLSRWGVTANRARIKYSVGTA
jgi:hypothetical protein